ncbi:AAA family ATPase [Lachnospiraceae bacterium 29-84]
MGMYLNSRVPQESFQAVRSGRYFVDKSKLLRELIPAVGTEERFFCITRPRRFGKSVAANMVAAFFGNSGDGKHLFQGLEIEGCEGYQAHFMQHDVVFIDFSRIPRNCASYAQYMERIQDGLNDDFIQAYPEAGLDRSSAVWDNLQAIFERDRKKFFFVIDEWDAPFHLDFVTERDKKDYLMFLRSLLKGQAYVELAYMTGVLPIAKYSSGSELNMFLEFDIATAERFSRYFGFLDFEVDRLYKEYLKERKEPKISRKDLAKWYDGYYTAEGSKLYNPRSVVYALSNNQLRGYWTSSGPYDEVFYYIRHNIKDICGDLALMVSGEGIESRMLEYAATSKELDTKDQIYSAMVVYGLLTYERESGKVFIPNKELMDKFHEMLYANKGLGYINRLARESTRMLKATLSGDTQVMAEILKFTHDTESPIFSYNSEIELAAVVNLVYLAARDKYRVEREDKAGEGYVDFIFYPESRQADRMILELKVDGTPEEAIQQIKDRKYALRFLGKLGEEPKYTGRLLAVGICYNKKTKEHRCKVEEL